MAALDFLNPMLNLVFGPFLKMTPFLAVLLISLIISLLITLVYKFFTNQAAMKDIKDQIKAYQQQIKALKDNPQEALGIQKKSMELNMTYMRHSFKATFITFIPIIIIFGWFNTHFAFMPLQPGEEFSVSVSVDKGYGGNITVIADKGMNVVGDAVVVPVNGFSAFNFKADKGSHLIELKADGKSFVKDVVVGSVNAPKFKTYDGPVKSVAINYNKLVVMPLFGWNLGWLGSYIIFSIVLSMLLRKVLKVY